MNNRYPRLSNALWILGACCLLYGILDALSQTAAAKREHINSAFGVRLPPSAQIVKAEYMPFLCLDGHSDAILKLPERDVPTFVRSLEPAPYNSRDGRLWHDWKQTTSDGTLYYCNPHGNDQTHALISPPHLGFATIYLDTSID